MRDRPAALRCFRSSEAIRREPTISVTQGSDLAAVRAAMRRPSSGGDLVHADEPGSPLQKFVPGRDCRARSDEVELAKAARPKAGPARRGAIGGLKVRAC